MTFQVVFRPATASTWMMTVFRPVSRVLLLLLTLLCARSRARVMTTSVAQGASTLPTSSERFLFLETCDDRWNEEKERTENCCKGNYKCSDDLCKGNAVCSFGFLQRILWCHVEKCTPKEVSKEDGSKDEGDKDEEDGEPQPSGEVDFGRNGDEGDGDQDSDPSPTPTLSSAASPSSSPSPPQNDDPLHCNGRRNRREIRDMTPQQRKEWQDAIVALRSDRDENGNSEWDRLVRLHIDNNDEAHGGSYFLPWHRLFLLRLENALRKIQPNFALPYWDWTQDAGDAARSRVWNPEFAGGAQRGDRPIQTGPFSNMEARQPFRHLVRRDFTSGTSGEIPLLWSQGSLDQLIAEPSWTDFTDGVESAHALPHIYIGGDMSDAHQAPNDPLFYLHHAFVDYLWSTRQMRLGPNQFGGTHDFREGTQNARSDRVLQAFGVPAGRTFNLDCVHYIRPNREGRSISGRGTRGTPANVCNNEAIRSGNTISEARCRRGDRILEREAAAAAAAAAAEE